MLSVYKRNNVVSMKYLIIVLIAVLPVLLVLSAWYAYGTDEVVTFTVEEKERIVKQSGEGVSSKYLIFTDNGVFENTDTVWYWKWNSSDVYGDLKEGEEYTVMVYGWRVPFLSMYKNIVEIN